MWQFQTQIRFPAVKQGLILEEEAKKSTYLNELDVRKPLVVSIAQGKEEVRLYNSGLEFDNIKSRLKSSIFKCISWLIGSFFGGDDRGFLKEMVRTYLMTPMSPHNSPTFFFCLQICSLWLILLPRQDFGTWIVECRVPKRTHRYSSNKLEGVFGGSQSLNVIRHPVPPLADLRCANTLPAKADILFLRRPLCFLVSINSPVGPKLPAVFFTRRWRKMRNMFSPLQSLALLFFFLRKGKICFWLCPVRTSLAYRDGVERRLMDGRGYVLVLALEFLSSPSYFSIKVLYPLPLFFFCW